MTFAARLCQLGNSALRDKQFRCYFVICKNSSATSSDVVYSTSRYTGNELSRVIPPFVAPSRRKTKITLCPRSRGRSLGQNHLSVVTVAYIEPKDSRRDFSSNTSMSRRACRIVSITKCRTTTRTIIIKWRAPSEISRSEEIRKYSNL